MKVLTMASDEVRTSDFLTTDYQKSGQVVLVGGTESMSNAPHLTYARQGVRFGNMMLVDGIQKDGLIDAYGAGAMGYCGEKTAKEFDISREIQDEFAL